MNYGQSKSTFNADAQLYCVWRPLGTGGRSGRRSNQIDNLGVAFTVCVLMVTDEAVLLFLYNDCPAALSIATERLPNNRHVCRHVYNIGKRLEVEHGAYDKYKLENIAKAVNYTPLVALFHPTKLKFGDEKHFEGAEIIFRGVRRNPITGVVPDAIVDSDFRNTYNLTEFCGIDPRSAPMSWTFQDGINDSEVFSNAIERAVVGNLLDASMFSSSITPLFIASRTKSASTMCCGT
jgi:hypothetical protein